MCVNVHMHVWVHVHMWACVCVGHTWSLVLYFDVELLFRWSWILAIDEIRLVSIFPSSPAQYWEHRQVLPRLAWHLRARNVNPGPYADRAITAPTESFSHWPPYWKVSCHCSYISKWAFGDGVVALNLRAHATQAEDLSSLHSCWGALNDL